MGKNTTPLTEIEKSIVGKIGRAKMPPATACKRFARDLSNGRIRELSDRGRAFLAFIAHRFRRQYRLSPEECEWIRTWFAEAAEKQPSDLQPSLFT